MSSVKSKLFQRGSVWSEPNIVVAADRLGQSLTSSLHCSPTVTRSQVKSEIKLKDLKKESIRKSSVVA